LDCILIQGTPVGTIPPPPTNLVGTMAAAQRFVIQVKGKTKVSLRSQPWSGVDPLFNEC